MAAILRFGPVATLILVAFSSAPPLQDDDPVYVDEEKKEFLEKIERCREAGDWKGLFDLQARASLPKNAHKLVRLPGPEPRFVGVVEHLWRRFADLPPEALQYYRGQHDGAAKREFDRARAAGDRDGLEKVVDTWFYSSRTDEALDLLANLHVEEGRPALAIHCWSRLLFHYPDSEIPRRVTAARLAGAAAASGQASILEVVRRHVAERGVDGDVIVADAPMALSSFLAGLEAAPRVDPTMAATRMPTVAAPGRPVAGGLVAVRPDIERWRAPLAPDARPERAPRRTAPAPIDFPYLPAYGRVDGHEMVVFTNGVKVTVVDPERVTSARPEEGVYFSYPGPDETPPRVQLPQDIQRGGGQITWVRPYIGATIDGDTAFVTLYSSKRAREATGGAMGGMPDSLFGTTRLVALCLRAQQVLWDTDYGESANQIRKLEFWERNFSLSGPPLVRGDRVYVGICTSPMGEEESRVLCLDRRTGLPLWERFLASVPSSRQWWGGGAFTSRLTILEEERGQVIAHSNLGVIASLDAVTGQIQWLTKYPRTGTGGGHGATIVFARPASPLVIHRGQIFALPQDAHELLIADLATGALRKDIPKMENQTALRTWRDFSRLVGRMGDYIFIGGTNPDTIVLNITSSQIYGLPITNTSGTGRGMIDGETVYLPTVSGGRGGLSLLHGLRNWSSFDKSMLWWPLNEPGNALRAGDFLVYATARELVIYTDAERVRSEYLLRLEQSPPNPAAWLDYGSLMKANGRWGESARGFLRFLAAVEGDPEWLSRSREVRTDLHGVFLKLGMESSGQRVFTDAAAHFARARDFAWDGPTLTEATRLLAGACESAAAARTDAADRLTWARRAVEEYHELLRRSPRGFVRVGASLVSIPTRRFASQRIAAIVEKHGAESYSNVERAAREELARMGAASPEALREFADTYAASASAAGAMETAAERHATQGRWTAAAAILRGLRERAPAQWTPARHRRLLEALEKAGDAERLEVEAVRMAGAFEAATPIGPEEQAPTVAAFAERMRAAAAALPRRSPEAPLKSTATLSQWDPATTFSRSDQVTVGWELLSPGGLSPLKWPADAELFLRGSSVELWNIRTKQRIWSAPHPGGWTGLIFTGPRLEGARGVRVSEVLPGSPAEKAGLKADDLIRSIDGVEADEATFDLATEARPPGTAFLLSYVRDDQPGQCELKTVGWPESSRPGIVGAVFTADGAVAVAWEDVVAAFDLADGRPTWVSRPTRDRFAIRAIHASAGRVLIHEHATSERSRSSLRIVDDALLREGLPPDDLHSRIIALDESDGGTLWASGQRFEWATASHHAVRFINRPLDARPAFLVLRQVPKARSTDIVVLGPDDGVEAKRISLATTSGLPASAIHLNAETGTLWIVEATGPNRRTLKSFTAPDYAKGPDVRLDTDLDPVAGIFSIASNRDRVVVASVSVPATPPRFAVYSAADSSLVAATGAESPIRDRAFPVGAKVTDELKHLAGLVSIDAEGTIYVYSEMRPAPGAAGAPKRASLTALRLKEGKFEMAGEAVVPAVTPAGLADRELLSVRSGPDGCLVTTFRGILPGKSEETASALFLDRKELRIQKMVDDLKLTFDEFGTRRDPAPLRRGRVFLGRATGLEILGE